MNLILTAIILVVLLSIVHSKLNTSVSYVDENIVALEKGKGSYSHLLRALLLLDNEGSEVSEIIKKSELSEGTKIYFVNLLGESARAKFKDGRDKILVVEKKRIVELRKIVSN